MKTVIPMTIDCEGVVNYARYRQYTPEQLQQCFHDMPREVAQDLLDGVIEITPGGRVYDPRKQEENA